MRTIREQAHGPYRRGNRWRVVETSAAGARSTVSFTSEAEALAYIAEYNRAATGRTVSEAVDAYLEAAAVKPSTRTTLKYRLFAITGCVARDRALSAVTPRVAAAMYAARVAEVRPDTHRGELAAASAWATWCVRRGWLRVNPFAEVEPEGRTARRTAHLRIDEARALRDACLDDASDAGTAVALALLLGLRAGEIVGLRARDIDDDARVVWIAEAKTAAGQRHLEVPDELRDRLRRLRAGRAAEDRVFPATRHWLNHHVARLCKLAGVPAASPHALRRTWSALAAETAPIAAVSRALGHASAAVTRRHYQPGNAEERRASGVALRVLRGGR